MPEKKNPDKVLPPIDLQKAIGDVNQAFDELNAAVKDGAYIAVGLGVLGLQRAQVRRVEMTRRLEAALREAGPPLAEVGRTVEAQVDEARTQLAGVARAVDAQLRPARAQLDEGMDLLEERLPVGARGVLHSVRSAVADSENALRHAVGLPTRR